MIAPVAGLLLAAACSLSSPATCDNTKQLVWSDGFEAAVAAFVGPRRAAYLYADAPVAAQMIQVLGGPPDRPARPGRYYRFTACRAHSCDEKGAAVLTSKGDIAPLAVLHMACALPDHGDHCTPMPR